VQPWLNEQNQYLDVAESLRDAMDRHPYLKVWVVCGYYDLATPYFSAKSTVAHMMLDPSIRSNLTMTYYESGHMVYINKPSHEKLKNDFETFLKGAVMPQTESIPTAAP
jgi:carboxypeptidase C (cathepsin A)